MEGCYRMTRRTMPEPTASSHEFQRIRFEKISRRARTRQHPSTLVLTSGNAANQTAPSAKRQRNFPARRLRARAWGVVT
jgi:hypothetical protein